MISREHQRRAPPPRRNLRKQSTQRIILLQSHVRAHWWDPSPPPHTPPETESLCAESERQELEQRKSSADNKKQTNEGREGGAQPFRGPEENRHLISLRTHTCARDGSCALHSDRLTPHCHYPHKCLHFCGDLEKRLRVKWLNWRTDGVRGYTMRGR